MAFNPVSTTVSDCLQVFRISEHCGDDCHPDMLAEHNSGDLLADVSFVHTRRGE